MTTQPWHQLCQIREDVRSGSLSLDEFAADLNDTRTGAAPAVYRDPALFFDRTYPTYQMKSLAAEVLKRLNGEQGKPVLWLQVTYGGGKTHTLISLLHLAERGRDFAQQRTVAEFAAFAGLSQLPQARVALLPCDKFDVKEGLEVYGPTGDKRRVKTLWGALAYQLAGDAGYARLKGHDDDFTVPAEPILVDLLKAPQADGLGSLVLVDEAVWYYRALVNDSPKMLGTIKDFYQVLTQAAAKVNRAALVAALIASRVEARDTTGTQCLEALHDVFQRVAEPIEPVVSDDVAEVLRRRLFESVAGPTERQSAIDGVMAAMQRLPVRDAQRDQAAYNRWRDSYPFHPDLIGVLYQKWTQLGRFQRTRGALRLLASALRESDGQDPVPVIGPGALLPYTQVNGISPALNELIEVCDEGGKWKPILLGELERVREIQAGLPHLKQRELEQAVVATFLHSQPAGQRAAQTDLLALLVHPAIDAASQEEGLGKWRGRSWFLVDNPDVWQLGINPNLTSMHLQAMDWISEPDIEDELARRIKAVRNLTAADSGVEVHTLPESYRAVSDDTTLRYVILGPKYAVEPGKPLPVAVEDYFNKKTDAPNSRIYRNNLLVLLPEVSRLAALREQVRRWLGWQRLEQPDTIKLLTDNQRKQLEQKKKEATNGLPEAMVGAYNILAAVNEQGQVEAQTLRADPAMPGTPFERIKFMLTEEERLLTTTLDPDLILPGSYLNLWGEGQTTRKVSDLMTAFGQFPRLPRLLRPDAMYDTLQRGVEAGALVLRLPRSDGSVRTWWRIAPDSDTLRHTEMEVQPLPLAELRYLNVELLAPDRLPGLWPAGGQFLTIGILRAYFDGKQAPRLAAGAVVDDAVKQAVLRGQLMARVPALGISVFREELLELGDTVELWPAPAAISAANLTPQAQPDAWQNGEASLSAVVSGLEAQRGYALPWALVRDAVDEALRLRLFELAGGAWPCSPAAMAEVKFRLIEKIELPVEMVVKAFEHLGRPAPTLREIKETIEQSFLNRIVPLDLFIQKAKEAIQHGLLVEVDPARGLNQVSDPLAVQVRQPDTALVAETLLDIADLTGLTGLAEELLMTAPELVYGVRVTLTAAGPKPAAETVQKLNKALEKIKAGWQLK
ncbi:MAG: hypothetical protein FOGNACKC_06219 [Anaerolineae bacterium]|nr:hypothetical protein [Anaerolineae bacterium]